MVTKNQQLVLDFASGKVKVDVVVAALEKAAVPARPPAKDAMELYRRMEDDDYQPLNMDGWDGVEALNFQDKLSDEKYAELRAVYMRP